MRIAQDVELDLVLFKVFLQLLKINLEESIHFY